MKKVHPKNISQEEAFLIFQEAKTLKKTSYTFSKESCSYISKNENPPKVLDISGKGNPKKLLIFQERYIQNLSITKLSYILG